MAYHVDKPGIAKGKARLPHHIPKPERVVPSTSADVSIPRSKSISAAELVLRLPDDFQGSDDLFEGLFASHSKASCASQKDTHASVRNTTSTSFQDLPVELHFRVAAYLPDHTLRVLQRYKHNARIRDIYANADPQGRRSLKVGLYRPDSSIYRELITRDAFETVCRFQRFGKLPVYNHAAWTKTAFHCVSCNGTAGLAHFPAAEILQSIRERTGMDKIIHRHCFAEHMTVRLWDKRSISWTELRDIWADMDPYIPLKPIFSDYGHDGKASPKQIAKSGRYTREPNTLKIRDWDYAPPAPTRYNGSSFERSGVHATAEYYVDLFTLMRFQRIDADTLINTIAAKRVVLCPHFHLASLMRCKMIDDPVEFRPNGPGPYDPKDRFADYLAKHIDYRDWRDASDLTVGPDSFARKIKDQGINCGFGNDECGTVVYVQRYRDEQILGWMTDLVRLKVVRVWRIDRGTGDVGWQAQNGSSAMEYYEEE